MSGLFRRLSSRRSAGPEGDEPQTAAQPGAADAATSSPAEPGGHRSLLTDPADETRVIEGAAPAGDTPTAADDATTSYAATGEATHGHPATDHAPAGDP